MPFVVVSRRRCRRSPRELSAEITLEPGYQSAQVYGSNAKSRRRRRRRRREDVPTRHKRLPALTGRCRVLCERDALSRS